MCVLHDRCANRRYSTNARGVGLIDQPPDIVASALGATVSIHQRLQVCLLLYGYVHSESLCVLLFTCHTHTNTTARVCVSSAHG